jgi:hypothetical protein
VSFPHGGVEHINHLTFEPTTDVVVHIGVNHPVEYRVYDVAHRAGQHQGNADEQSPIGLIANALNQVPETESRDYEAEKGKDQFANFTPTEEFHTIGHAIVFDKIEFKPIAEDGTDFAQHKMGFDINFNALIEDEQQQNGGHRNQKLPIVE